MIATLRMWMEAGASGIQGQPEPWETLSPIDRQTIRQMMAIKHRTYTDRVGWDDSS